MDDPQSWERLLSQLEEPASALSEIRQFADQWWTFYSSLNESFFYSIPRQVRDQVVRSMYLLCAVSALALLGSPLRGG